MDERDVERVFRESGAFVTGGHFVYSSGKHGAAYVNKDAVYARTRSVSVLCREIAGRFADGRIDAVIAPATGGIVLSQWTAHHLTEITGREVFSVYAEKMPDNGSFSVNRGYRRFIAGRRVLVVEDVLTTGRSADLVVRAARSADCDIVGLGALWNRGGVTAAAFNSVPRFTALLTLTLEAWDPSVCPLCASDTPFTAV